MKIITDKNEALELIKKEPKIILLCSDKLQADKEVVLEAVKQDSWALQYASKELKADRSLLIRLKLIAGVP